MQNVTPLNDLDDLRILRCCAVFTVSSLSDQYLLHGTLVAIRSLRLTNPGLDILIIYEKLTATQLDLFSGYRMWKVNMPPLQRSSFSLGDRPDLDASVFLRFFVDIPPLEKYDYLIYLDSDLVVLDDITDILLPANRVYFGRFMAYYSIDSQFLSGKAFLDQEGISENASPVNAGVLYINLKRWRECDFLALALSAISTIGIEEYIYNDQSLINHVGLKHQLIGGLPDSYNFMIWPDVLEGPVLYPRSANRFGLIVPRSPTWLAKIVHWTGPMKPWLREFKEQQPELRRLMLEDIYTQFTNHDCTPLPPLSN